MKWWGPVSCVALVASSIACSGQTSRSNAGSAGAPNSADQTPWWTLPIGSRYFSRDSRQAPLLMRNISAPSAAQFIPLLQAAHAAGAQAVRVQLTQGFGYDTLGIDAHGAVRADWAASWDAVFEAAQEQQLAVIPVFGIWGDWNSGVPEAGWTHFAANPLSQALGGPAASPADLFVAGETQRAWLGWLSALIDRWHKYPNIIAWEIFSELDLASGSTEENATDFAERASDVIRAGDPEARPVFASTSDLPLVQGEPWLKLWTSRAADLVSVHPYDANLDETVKARVQVALAATPKPVFIGESGLDAAAPDGTTLTSSPSARAGLQQAVWTELATGAATARALYWEDGYAAYYPETGLNLVHAMNDLDSVAAGWLDQADYTDLVPALGSWDPQEFAAVLANQNQVRGWVRSSALAPPDWTAPPLPAIPMTISLSDGTKDGDWTVKFTTPTGDSLPDAHGYSSASVLYVASPGGFSSFAFVATRVSTR
jgi:hypothetical protein